MRRFLFALVPLVVGCDPVVDKHTPDAAKEIDAAPDAPTHGMVSVKVYDPANNGMILVGAPVVFVEADGTVVGHPTTGTDGIAMADVHRGATATAVVTTPNEDELLTMTGLVPGDTITLGPNYVDGGATDGTFSVSFPTYPGAVNYRVYGPCGSGSSSASPQTLTMYNSCKQATMELQVVAYDQASNPVGYIDKTGVAYTAGGNAAITGSYLALQNFTATYTNVDAGINSVNMNRVVPDSYGFSRGAGAAPTNGMVVVSATGSLGAAAQVISRAVKGRNDNQVIQSIAGNTLTYSMDVGATLLPWINQPTYDATTHKLTVPVDMAGTTSDAPDLFYAEMNYTITMGTTSTSYLWLVFSGTAGDVTLPTLPPELGDVMPHVGDPIGMYAQMFELDNVSGFDAVRPDVYGFVFRLQAANNGATKYRISTYGGG